MIRALNTAATGMSAQETKIDVVANNIANVNTNGFKKIRGEFQDLLYETMREPGSAQTDGTALPTGMQVGNGVRTVATLRQFSMGSLRETGNALDIAIEGDGFFQIQRPDGQIGYTRDGSFKLDAEGRIVNSNGMFLEPNIVIPPDVGAITIGTDGTVETLVEGQTTPVEVGRIEMARFINPAGLKGIGRNMLIETEASGKPVVATPGADGMGILSQGFVESSNVKVVEEMIDLITTQRAYESNSKIIQAADEMMRATSNLR